MFFPVTPYLIGKLHGLEGRVARCPFEAGSAAAEQYTDGYQRGRTLRGQL